MSTGRQNVTATGDGVPVAVIESVSGSGAKRILDVLVGVTAIVVLSPLILVAAACVKATSPGPVLYRQERVGRRGERFWVVKFRTMRVGTHEEILGDPTLRATYESNGWKLDPDDPRITRVGRWLRKTSLDELPQLLNVIAGDMSLVGVRPLLADELARRAAYDQLLYCSMRPGMTGLWQVEGRSALDDVDRLELDRSYVERWSLWGDVVLLARTPAAVLHVSQAQ
jgi:lipopolysaccharide/colanic/teichoic acid biosynthesis glycosyltransferase